MKYLLIFISSILAVYPAFSQPPVDVWRLYDAGSDEDEWFYDLYNLSEGGYFVCGNSDHRRWLLRLDEEGNVVWNIIGEADTYHSVIETDRQEALVGGKIAAQFGAELFDQDGGLLWSYQYQVGRCKAVIELKNGNFVLAGSASEQGCIVILTPEGDVVWERLYGNADPGNDQFYSFLGIRETEGGIVVVGQIINSNSGISLKVDFDGNLVWERIFDGNRTCTFSCLVSMQDGFMIGGYSTRDWGGYNTCAFVITKINADGEMQFQRTYPERRGIAQDLYGIAKTEEEELLLAGWSNHFGDGNANYYPHLMCTDSEGDTLWINRFVIQAEERRDSNHKQLTSVVVDQDGVIAVCGIFGNPGDNSRGEDGLFATITPERAPARVIYKYPEEDSLRMLRESSQLFAVRIRNPAHMELNISWLVDDSTLAEDADTSLTIEFNSIGDYTVRCQVEAGEWIRAASWLVQVRDLLIISKSPDTSAVTLWRGEPSTFSMDSIAVVNEGEISYNWSLLDLEDLNQQFIGDRNPMDVTVDRAGRFSLIGEAFQNGALDSVVWILTVNDIAIARYSPAELNLAVRHGSTVSFSIDSVSAPIGGQIDFQWILRNLDNLSEEYAGAESTAVVEFPFSGFYQVEGAAYRGESSDNVIWTIAIRSAILDFWPRELHLIVPPDSSGEFGVIPFNPESDSLSYRWKVDGDSVGSNSTVALRFAWDDRRIGNPPHLVSAIVMDGAEGDTVKWEVTVQDPNATPPTPPSIEGGESPTTFGMLSVSPNPFNNSTTIRFAVPFGPESAQPAKSAVRLTVHDLTGREVARLVDRRAQQSPPSRGGPYAVVFDGRDISAGIYLVKLQAGEMQKVAKVVLVR